jgi:hypothetical protein
MDELYEVATKARPQLASILKDCAPAGVPLRFRVIEAGGDLHKDENTVSMFDTL